MYGHMCMILSFSSHVCSYMYLYVSRYPEVGETWKCALAQQTYFKDTIHFLKISTGEHFFEKHTQRGKHSGKQPREYSNVYFCRFPDQGV